MSGMSDRSATDQMNSDDGGSGPHWRIIAVVVLVIAALIVLAFVVFGGDDDDDDDGATATTTVDTATVETTLPGVDTSVGPDTTMPTVATTEAPPVTDPDETTVPASEFEFTIEDIDDGGTIPVEFTCDGEEQSPIVTVEAIPEGVLQLVFVVDDPDAPTANPFVHWLVYNIPGNETEIVAFDDDLTFGVNDAGEPGWAGPCPPSGDGAHEYVFTLYGLNVELELEPDLDGREVAEAIADAVVAETAITATYERA